MAVAELDDRPSIITISAAPGWCVCALYRGASHLINDPVVAWEITRYDARPMRNRPGRREPIRRYLVPVSTNGDLNANAAPEIDGWCYAIRLGVIMIGGAPAPNSTRRRTRSLISYCNAHSTGRHRPPNQNIRGNDRRWPKNRCPRSKVATERKLATLATFKSLLMSRF